MAKEIDKIIQSKTAPKSNNVLWDDGENLKINRNGVWENTNKNAGGEIDPLVWKYMCNPIVITSLDDTLPVDILETDDSGSIYIKPQYAGFIRGGYNIDKQKYVEACAVLNTDINVYDRVYIGDINDCAHITLDGTFMYA